MIKRWFVSVCLAASVAQGASLPTGLSAGDVGRIVELLGVGSVSRVLRTGESYEQWLGFKVGLEIAIVPMRDINLLGNGDGSIPSINPVPRIYIAKGIIPDWELIVNFFPSSLATVSTFGLTAKWTAQKEPDATFSIAPFLSLTTVSGAGGTYSGKDIELGALISKDYVRLKPYLGGGILLANGTVTASQMASGTPGSGSKSTLHLFFGAEFQFAIDLAFQFDLMGLSPMGSIFLGKRF